MYLELNNQAKPLYLLANQTILAVVGKTLVASIQTANSYRYPRVLYLRVKLPKREQLCTYPASCSKPPATLFTLLTRHLMPFPSTTAGAHISLLSQPRGSTCKPFSFFWFFSNLGSHADG